MATIYTTTSAKRGECGHRHRSIASALRCLEKDEASARARGETSDRRILADDGDGLRALTPAETDQLYQVR